MNSSIISALDNIVGAGAQHEHTCDRSEHDAASGCIWCEARTVLAQYRTRGRDCAQLLINTIHATGGMLSFEDGTFAPRADPEWIDLADPYFAACAEKGIEPEVTVSEDA